MNATILAIVICCGRFVCAADCDAARNAEQQGWVVTEPGVAALAGTDFKITYDAGSDNYLVAWRNGAPQVAYDWDGAIEKVHTRIERMQAMGIKP